jgi:hypothetical protein
MLTLYYVVVQTLLVTEFLVEYPEEGCDDEDDTVAP